MFICQFNVIQQPSNVASIGETLGGWFRGLGHAIGSLFTASVDAETGAFTAFFAIKDDITAMIARIDGFKRFTFDPKWKTRVINVPRAVEGFQDLYDIIFHSLRDKFDELRQAVETVVATIEQHPPPGDEGPSGIANVQARLTTIKLAIVNFQAAFHLALDLEQTLLDIKQRIETLDDLFLPQGNTKKTVDEHYRKRQRS